MPPADFCSSALPEHTSDPPKPCRSVRRQAATRQVAHPLARGTSRVALGQGLLWLFSPFNPPHDDRSPQGIYPNLTDSDTLCRSPVPTCT
jgi:hypothetical protein